MRTFVAGLLTVTLFLGCQLDTGTDPLDEEGDGGGAAEDGAGGTSGASGTGGSSAGTASGAGAGGSAGTSGKGSGGSIQGGAAGLSSGGKGGSSLGGSGSGPGGRGGKGGSEAGVGGTANAGKGGGGGTQAGSSNAGTSSGGAAGSGECTQDIRCELDALPSTGDVHQDCVDRINQFRTECACLPPLERWTEGEACADQMAEYDSTADGAHAGFRDEICEGGSAQNECPGWRSETQVVEGCLQQMWDEGPPPQDPCNDACFQEYGHFINMTNTRHTRVACGFYTTPDNEVWSVQNFSR